MSNVDDNGYWSKDLMLRDAYPEIVPKIAENLARRGLERVADQIKDILVPYQVPNGASGEFSFMAYSVPRLTPEERQLMALKEAETIMLDDLGIRIDVDDFGKIAWFYIKNMPEMYELFQRSLSFDAMIKLRDSVPRNEGPTEPMRKD
ncbi:hypothetical protein ACO0KY_17825 [Undibacterium sp. Dicai25W]|uniref:hypothetical protein n=1 Tax=Undibacterium sp. Dicai25W TaxID=3413034 RepID=UPI003BF1299E